MKSLRKRNCGSEINRVMKRNTKNRNNESDEEFECVVMGFLRMATRV